MEFISRSAQETEQFAQNFAQKLQGGEVLALYGGMGMGKTTFTRGLMQGLGVDSGVCSPTFALVHAYKGRLSVYHFDMFRVEGWDDLDSTGFFDYLGTDAVLVIEWSEHIQAALPKERIEIYFAQGKLEHERRITVKGDKV